MRKIDKTIHFSAHLLLKLALQNIIFKIFQKYSLTLIPYTLWSPGRNFSQLEPKLKDIRFLSEIS